MHAIVDVAGNELGKHDSRLSVQCGIPEVVLPGRAKRGVNDKLVRGRVVFGCRRNGRDVRPVSRFGHRIDTRKF